MNGAGVDPREVEWWSVHIGLLSTHVMVPLDALKAALKDDALLQGGEGAWLKVSARASRLGTSADSAKGQLGAAPTPDTAAVAALFAAIFDEAIRTATKIERDLETPSEFAGFGGFFASVQVIAALVTQVAAKAPREVKVDPPQRPRREAISVQVRREVWKRDEGRCVECGSRERLEYDHIIAVANGGSNTARNIELRCETCNRRKGATI